MERNRMLSPWSRVRLTCNRGTHSVKVLIIDDDQLVLRAYQQVLERYGFDVTAFDNAFSAFAEFDKSDFHAIACDHKMPYLDGKTFYEQLEQSFPTLASRVVFVTGWAGEPEVGSFLHQTGQPVLLKPVEAAELIRVVKAMASRQM